MKSTVKTFIVNSSNFAKVVRIIADAELEGVKVEVENTEEFITYDKLFSLIYCESDLCINFNMDDAGFATRVRVELP